MEIVRERAPSAPPNVVEEDAASRVSDKKWSLADAPSVPTHRPGSKAAAAAEQVAGPQILPDDEVKIAAPGQPAAVVHDADEDQTEGRYRVNGPGCVRMTVLFPRYAVSVFDRTACAVAYQFLLHARRAAHILDLDFFKCRNAGAAECCQQCPADRDRSRGAEVELG